MAKQLELPLGPQEAKAKARATIAKVIETKGDFEVHQSGIKTWRKCRYAYHLRYVELIRKKRKSRPLQFGSIVHSMLEAYANSDDPFEVLDKINVKDMKVFRAEKEEYGEIIEDIRCIMTEYFDFWPESSLTWLRRNKRGAEHKFNIELWPGVRLSGRIDAFVKTPNKLRWLAEHKTFGQLPNEDQRWRNLQSSVYIRVNDMMGWPRVDGTLWDYIHSKPPARPEILKSGKMSQRGINTLPSRVLETLAEHKLDPRNFKTMMDSAVSNRARYFIRVFTPDKPGVVQKLWDDMVETVHEMELLHGRAKAKTIDKHCSWCDYEGICRAELTGSDADYIREREYKDASNEDFYGQSPATEDA